MSSAPNPYDSSQTTSHERPPTEQGNALKYCFFGCLIIALLTIVGVSVGGYLLYVNAKAIAVNTARSAMVAVIEDTELPEADKREIVKQIDRVSEDYKDGKITLEQVGQIMDELGESPLIAVGMVYFIEQQYVVNSGLSEAEKADAKLTLHRAARGVHEKKISDFEIEQATAPVMTTGSDGEQQLKEHVTDEELREFLAKLKQLVDEKEIPEEEFKVNIGEEFRKAVDKVYEKPAP